MTDKPDKDAKTEEATPRRIEEALRKGNTPTSRELVSFTTIASLPVALYVAAASFPGTSLDTLQKLIDSPHEFRLQSGADVTQLLIGIGWSLLPSVAVPMLILMLASIVGALVQNPLQLAGERIKPNYSRISVTGGWERIFGTHGRVELVKALFKFLVLGFVAMSFFGGYASSLLNALLIAPVDLPRALLGKTAELLVTLSIVLSGLAMADVIWSRIKWRAELRMSKQEIKDEHKQAEGDPIVRARQRSVARDRARRRMLAAVPRATLVIANPTHYAVALRYARGEQAAPLVVAKGLDHIALRIREIAEANDIPVVEDRALARSLHDAVVPDRPIPPEFYKAVAEIIIYLMSRGPAANAGPAQPAPSDRRALTSSPLPGG